jgi:ABC-2 type transport system ATP-binding protein
MADVPAPSARLTGVHALDATRPPVADVPRSGDGAGRAVVVDGVWKRFGSTDVVRELSFDLRPGELLGFLGPNGAGKTTTMRMILDIIRPDRGSITVFGGAPGIEHQRRVGYLPEDRGLYRDVPVLDTLTYFGALRGMSTADARARARALLTEVGLGDSLAKKAGELSRGMHQKAQLIATIMNEPDLLIVDEPFQGLDPVNSEMLKGVLLAQRDRGAAVVMSTHDMEDAQALCDRILLIDGGRRLLYGTVAEVRRAFADGAVAVTGTGIPLDAAGYRCVTHVTETADGARFLLRDDATAQDLFRELAATDALVERFAVEAPNLNEIFIRTVAGDHRAETVR